MKLNSNILDTALIIEGGGMRCSYTAGIISKLVEENVFFNYVAGVSAGASNSVNYLSRDIDRIKKSFVDIVLDKNFGGWMSFFKGEGFFRSKYIYEETPLKGGTLPFDFEKFTNNSAILKLGAFDRDLGDVTYFSKDDIKTMNDLMKIVRASSTLPFFMPQTYFKGRYYLDGGLGGGIPLDVAIEDGYNKFFVILSRPKGYRKLPYKNKFIVKAYYHKYKHVADAIINRHIKYNKTLEHLEKLQDSKRALIVYPESMSVDSNERDFDKLNKNYEYGYEQAARDITRWKEFLY